MIQNRLEVSKEPYQRDAAKIHTAGVLEGIYEPTLESELLEVLQEATARGGTLVTSVGARTGLAGGAVATEGGIAIGMANMLSLSKREGYELIEARNVGEGKKDIAYLLAHDQEEAVFAAGVTLAEMEELLHQRNLWYQPDPTARSAQIGASVSTRGSGARTYRFGDTGKHVTYLRMVLADGDVLSIRRGEVIASAENQLVYTTESGKTITIDVPSYRIDPQLKNAAGLYAQDGMDGVELLVGSEGTLGIFSEVGLKVQPYREINTRLLLFGAEKDALEFITQARAQHDPRITEPQEGIEFLCLEFVDQSAGAFGKPTDVVTNDTVAAVEIKYYADKEEGVSQEIERGLVEQDGLFGKVLDVEARDSTIDEFRRSVPKYVNETVLEKVGTDIAVPRDTFPLMWEKYVETREIFSAEFPGSDKPKVAIWGHAGNDHLHLNFIATTNEQVARAKVLKRELITYGASLGGTVSGEHGTGKITFPDDEGVERPYLWFMLGDEGLLEIWKVVEAFNPEARLNRGNIVHPDYVRNDILSAS